MNFLTLTKAAGVIENDVETSGIFSRPVEFVAGRTANGGRKWLNFIGKKRYAHKISTKIRRKWWLRENTSIAII